jgi:hypothetical protein
MASFNKKVSKKNTLIIISGDITGDQDYPDVSTKTITIDLKEIGYINSSGIRGWINWKKQSLEDIEFDITVANCPREFIDQINLLSDMLPKNTKIQSFFVPYYNEENDEIHNILFESTVDFNGDQVRCKEQIEFDGKLFELDIDIDEYFSFLRRFG